MSRVLIAGCGYLGTALGLHLASAGHSAFALRRSHSSMPSILHPIAADLGRLESLRAMPSDLDHVVFTAAPDESSDSSYERLYVRGLANLILAVGRSLRGRLVFTSSTSVYAQQGGEWVDEASATAPAHYTGKRLLEAERLALTSGLSPVVLRLGGIYGPGRAQLLARVREGRATFVPGRYTNRNHAQDCVGAIVHLLGLPDPEPVYLGTDCSPTEEEVVLRWLASAMGAPTPISDPSSRGRVRSSKRCRNARLLASGYEFRYPSFREGYASLLGHEEMGQWGAKGVARCPPRGTEA